MTAQRSVSTCLILALILCTGCALTRTVGKIIPGGGDAPQAGAEADTSAAVVSAETVTTPEVKYREVTRYRNVTKQVAETCQGQRWVPGEIDASEYHRIAVYPLEVRGFNRNVALYWSQVIEDWLVATNHYSVVTRAELDKVFSKHNLGRGEPMDPEIMAVLRRAHGIHAVVHGTVHDARGGSTWELHIMDSASGKIIGRSDGSGDLSAAVPAVLSPILGCEQTYTYPCTTTVTERVPYVVREKYVAEQDAD